MEIKKLTEEELTQIKKLRADLNVVFGNIGVLTARIKDLKSDKKRNLEALLELQLQEKQIFETLKNKYGEGVVDLSTGEFRKE